MYNLVLPFTTRTKAPVYEVVTAASGTLTYSSATWTLTSNAGTLVSSGSVDGASGTGTATVTVYKDIDAPTLVLAAGVYILHFETLATGSDTVARQEPYDVVIYIPGTVSRTINPTAADLQVFLVGAKLIKNPPTSSQMLIDLDSAVNDAINWWQLQTGYAPFLAGASDTTRYFTPPGANEFHQGPLWYSLRGGSTKLWLDSGAKSITSVVTGISYDSTGAVVAGTTLVENTDYVLYPLNYAAKSLPVEWIEFYTRLWGSQKAISVTGKFGYANPLPDSAWNAIQKKSAGDVCASVLFHKFGGVPKPCIF